MPSRVLASPSWMPVLTSAMRLRALAIASSMRSNVLSTSGFALRDGAAARVVPSSSRVIARSAASIGGSMWPAATQRSARIERVLERALGPFAAVQRELVQRLEPVVDTRHRARDRAQHAVGRAAFDHVRELIARLEPAPPSAPLGMISR